MKVYTVITTQGSYDDRVEYLAYAGIDPLQAIEAADNAEFYDKSNNFIHIKVWEHGKHLKEVCIEPDRLGDKQRGYHIIREIAKTE